jgi:hypothetical protein
MAWPHSQRNWSPGYYPRGQGLSGIGIAAYPLRQGYPMPLPQGAPAPPPPLPPPAPTLSLPIIGDVPPWLALAAIIGGIYWWQNR